MPVSIGTDCSGMEAPIQALRSLGVDYRHVFSCDIDAHARATIRANFPHGVLYQDLTQRDNATAPPCDLYVAGFPCQPFSIAGMKQGFGDKHGRGQIFFHVRDYINTQRPKAFILENVKGLRTMQNGVDFDAIMQSLEQLGAYSIYFDILGTHQHGVPHHRNRCYFVGIRKDVDRGDFAFPKPIPCPSLEMFLEPRSRAALGDLPPASQGTARRNVTACLRALKREGSDPTKEPWVMDCDSSEYRAGWNFNVSPCITVCRRHGHWVTNRGRRFYKTEMMRLQGMDPTKFKVAITENQLGRQIGNTMSVNVLERLMCRLLPSAGLVPRNTMLRDRWADGSALRKLAATRCLKFAQRFAGGAARRLTAAQAAASTGGPPGGPPGGAAASARKRSAAAAATASAGGAKRHCAPRH